MAEIFGKDRANGKGAETPADAIEEMDCEDGRHNIENIVGHDGLDEIDMFVPLTQTPTSTSVEGGSKH